MNEKDLLFTKDHEWISLKEGCAFIGITNHAQSELGDIIFVEFPEVGEEFNSNDVFGTIEAVKTVADLYMPVSSKILEINEALDAEPETINNDPYNNGWIVKVKLKNNDDLKSLLSYDDYKKII